MDKKAKTIIPVAIISILLLLIISPYIVYGIFVAVDNNREITGEDILKSIEKNRNISIPRDGKIEYGYESPDRWFGEGERYVYITFENEPTEFLKDFEKNGSDEFEKNFDELMKSIEGEIAVKSVIDWSGEYVFKSVGDSLNIVYFPKVKKMYILEVIF